MKLNQQKTLVEQVAGRINISCVAALVGAVEPPDWQCGNHGRTPSVTQIGMTLRRLQYYSVINKGQVLPKFIFTLTKTGHEKQQSHLFISFLGWNVPMNYRNCIHNLPEEKPWPWPSIGRFSGLGLAAPVALSAGCCAGLVAAVVAVAEVIVHCSGGKLRRPLKTIQWSHVTKSRWYVKTGKQQRATSEKTFQVYLKMVWTCSMTGLIIGSEVTTFDFEGRKILNTSSTFSESLTQNRTLTSGTKDGKKLKWQFVANKSKVSSNFT